MAPIRLTRTAFASFRHDGGLQLIQLHRAGVFARAVQQLAAFVRPRSATRATMPTHRSR
jgi:hypothetical protein